MASDDENPPSATVYINNLNERTKIPKLVDALRDLFGEVGTVLDIVAKKNVKAKGQAFVAFESADEAQDAIETLQGFEVFGKPMHLAFSKSRSDVTVEKEDGEEGLETHKRHRLAEKERKQAVEAAQRTAKRPAPESLAERPAKTAKAANQMDGKVPDEYLPANKVLFVQELPEDYGKDALTAIFSRFPGFKEVRTVPSRKTIAFVEYENEEGAITAKAATAGMTLGDKAIKVTFRRE